jgi:fructose/tagatose bisphosphate aldolase
MQAKPDVIDVRDILGPAREAMVAVIKTRMVVLGSSQQA